MPAIARVGDEVECPKHGKTTIATGGSKELDGQCVARRGDECACGCKIIEGSVILEEGGQPVAYVGVLLQKPPTGCRHFWCTLSGGHV